jgi:hypothetical protein
MEVFMKKYKVLLTFILLIALSMTFISCNNNSGSKNVTAYGLVGSSYLCEIKIDADSSGRVVSVNIDEFYMPTSLCQAKNYSGSAFSSEDIQTVVNSSGKEVEYVKNIDIDGENFELVTIEYKDGEGKSYDPKRYTIDYKSSKKTSLNTYISTDEGGEWYVKMLRKGAVTVGKMADKKYQKVAEVSYMGGICKSSTGYWSTDLGTQKGWALNIQLIQTQLAKEFNKENVVSLSDAAIETMKLDSGATITSFKDYINLAFTAYNKIKDNK